MAKMLCVLLQYYCLFCLTISSLSAQESDAHYNCSLPPWPKNGGFNNLGPRNRNINHPYPKVQSYHLKLYCDKGFKGVGSDTMVCFEDGRKIDTDFECIPFCKQSNTLLSCGANRRCYKEPEKPEPITSYSTPKFPLQANYEACGSPEKETSRRRRQIFNVFGGRNARRAEQPWHAGIYTKKTRPYMQVCGGTLVATNVVISAAHCFWDEVTKQQPASEFAVAVGKLYRPWNEPRDNLAQKSDVAEIRIPPYFQGHATNLQDDIAMVILASPFNYAKNVRPVCLNFNEEFDKKQLEHNTLGKVAGWGLTSADGPPSPILNVIEIPVVDIKQCIEKSEPTFRPFITSDKICAGGWQGGTNGTAVCKGDSGGGFSIPDPKTKYRFFLRGVVSGAPQSEHLCNVYAWATFTHVLKHEQFIKKTLQDVNAEVRETLP